MLKRRVNLQGKKWGYHPLLFLGLNFFIIILQMKYIPHFPKKGLAHYGKASQLLQVSFLQKNTVEQQVFLGYTVCCWRMSSRHTDQSFFVLANARGLHPDSFTLCQSDWAGANHGANAVCLKEPLQNKMSFQ